jgi:hypothetical protein
MPRIAAALTIVVAVALCIAFNIARYPAVWDMTAAAHLWFHSGATKPASDGWQPVAAIPSAPAEKPPARTVPPAATASPTPPPANQPPPADPAARPAPTPEKGHGQAKPGNRGERKSPGRSKTGEQRKGKPAGTDKPAGTGKPAGADRLARADKAARADKPAPPNRTAEAAPVAKPARVKLDRPLVPVVFPTVAKPREKPAGPKVAEVGAQIANPFSPDGSLRRLPRVDPAPPRGATPSVTPSANAQYPSTGS